ncbi:CBM35 domain-containing protein [Streptomyces sp. NPDC020875]|uniref:CBM35 domain-containing protein n=1 Tax=Streptomyces sp. NPDC020875 TaxID=3154898 RepID=UPI0033C0194D
MTAANNGGGRPNGSTPEDDDPFGYLYEDGQAAGATRPGQARGGYGYPGPASQPGVPRTSYNQVRAVGERQYGHHQQQAPQQPGYGYPPPQQQAYGQQPYHQPAAQYAAPETYPGGTGPGRHGSGPPTVPGGAHGSGGRGRGPNTRGLLIGAVAVVAVVVVGITVAIVTKDAPKDTSEDKQTVGGPASPAPSAPDDKAEERDKDKDKEKEETGPLPKQDAVTLQLGGNATTDTSIEGAEGTGGAYVTQFNQVGSSVTWKAKIRQKGEYRLYVRYTIPAKDALATLTINGKANTNPIGLKNFIGASDPALDKNWQTTWAPVSLKEGENEIKISCETGDQCDVNLDWLEVRKP